ncbi:hypothetical protein GCM10027034_03940 [Ramlibacter solisilvae]
MATVPPPRYSQPETASRAVVAKPAPAAAKPSAVNQSVLVGKPLPPAGTDTATMGAPPGAVQAQ